MHLITGAELLRQKDFIKEAYDRNIKINQKLHERLNRFQDYVKQTDLSNEAGTINEAGTGYEAGAYKGYNTLYKEIKKLEKSNRGTPSRPGD